MVAGVEELEPYTKAVNDAAARVRGLWLGYIALLAYLFIAVFAVTHRDLLLENPVSLPILNVELPMVGFFFVAPGLFIINHFYLLLQLKGLSSRIREFNCEIRKASFDSKTRRRERRRLDTFVIVQMLGGTREEREQRTGSFLKIIALITLVLAPIALLLVIQLQFLAYQLEWITWWHRFAIAVDLVLLCVFWPAIRLGDWVDWKVRNLRTAEAKLNLSIAVSSILFFSCCVATFPGEYADIRWQSSKWTKPQDSSMHSLKHLLFGELPNSRSYHMVPNRSATGFYRAMYLPDAKTLIDLDRLDKIRRRHKDDNQLQSWEMDRTLSLERRYLRGAVFYRSDLRNVDLYDAHLQGATLSEARLQGASLEFADLQGASLEFAGLQGASLVRANLQSAWLTGAKLQGARLGGASLEDARLKHARLQGAWLVSAYLKGAFLGKANLQGAWLDNAYLQGALLREANLQGASLRNAKLQGASLDQANLQGALLREANLQVASLRYADLTGASLNNARLQGASLDHTRLQGASLENAELWRSHGIPFIQSPSQIWIRKPKLEALTKKQLASVKKQALASIISEELGKRVRRRLARLSAPEEDNEGALLPAYWKALVRKSSKADHQRQLADLLRKLACREHYAPFVAQALISIGNSRKRHRLLDVGPVHLPQVAQKLLDGAEGRAEDCPGAKGLGAHSTGYLRKWTTKPVQNTTNQREWPFNTSPP